MNCPVCFQPVDVLQVKSSYTEVVCLGCGHFQISSALRSYLDRRQFATRPTRQRLQERRQKTPIPMLGINDEDLLIPK